MKHIKSNREFVNELNRSTLISAAKKAKEYGQIGKEQDFKQHAYNQLEGVDIFELAVLGIAEHVKRLIYTGFIESKIGRFDVDSSITDVFKKERATVEFNFLDVINGNKYKLTITLKDGVWTVYRKSGRDFQPCAFFEREEAKKFMDLFTELEPKTVEEIKEKGEFTVNSILL